MLQTDRLTLVSCLPAQRPKPFDSSSDILAWQLSRKKDEWLSITLDHSDTWNCALQLDFETSFEPNAQFQMASMSAGEGRNMIYLMILAGGFVAFEEEEPAEDEEEDDHDDHHAIGPEAEGARRMSWV